VPSKLDGYGTCLMEGRTAIVIAHRLSTVRSVDRILVFHQGRVVEQGSHAKLLAIEDGHYRTLYAVQAQSLASKGLWTAGLEVWHRPPAGATAAGHG